MAKPTKQQQREHAMAVAVARARAELGFDTDKELSEYLRIPQTTLSDMKNKRFQGVSFGKVCEIARQLRLTPEEWCAAAGIAPVARKEAAG